MRVHLDTDFAGDTDDACALAYLLAREDLDMVGVTTVADADGRRAAHARYFLELAGRPDVPVAAGAAQSLTTGEQAGAGARRPAAFTSHWLDTVESLAPT